MRLALQSGTKRIRNAHFQCPNPPEHVRPLLRRLRIVRPIPPFDPFRPPLARSLRAFNLNVNPDLKFRGALSNDVPFNSSDGRTDEDGARIRKGEGGRATIRHNSIWNTLLICSGGQ